MALSTATLVALNTLVDAQTTETAVVTELIPGLIDVCVAEMSRTQGLTPNQQNHIAAIRAECVANLATFATSITIA
jgi:hypothetical protein